MNCPAVSIVKRTNLVKEGTFCDSKALEISYKTFSEIQDVPAIHWDSLSQGKSVFFQRNYLEALENSFDSELQSRFIVFYKDSEPVGIASLQITDFVGEPLGSNLSESKGLVKGIFKVLGIQKNGFRYRLLVCGNAFATGEHGFVFKPQIDNTLAMEALSRAVNEIIDLESKKEKISAILMKDFYKESLGNLDTLSGQSYSDIMVDPNMILNLDPDWITFDDYLNSMTSKFRTKAKSAYKKSKDLKVLEIGIDDVLANAERFQELYENVYAKASFGVGKLNFKAFIELKKNLGEQMILKAYYLNEKMVGFLIAFDYQDILDAHFVGLDYALNQTYSIYSRMLYDYVDLAISLRKKVISFGRTAGEIKSTVGAVPVDLKIFIRINSLANPFAKLVFNYLKPSDFPVRRPFKRVVYNNGIVPSVPKEKLRSN